MVLLQCKNKKVVLILVMGHPVYRLRENGYSNHYESSRMDDDSSGVMSLNLSESNAGRGSLCRAPFV